MVLTGIWDKLYNLFNYIGSIVVALLRLLILLPMLTFSALNQILFARYEVCTFEMRLLPLRCDRQEALDKLSYVDKLCAENPELLDIPEKDEEFDDKFDDDDNLDGHGDSNI